MQMASEAPILERFAAPVQAAKDEKRWLDGLSAQEPVERDAPCRFFRW